MNTWRCFLLTLAMATVPVFPARGEFVRGNIYVTVFTGEPSCFFEEGDPSAIVEINPDTGEMRIFAHSDDHPMCVPSGLRFTPDGQHLLLLDWWWSTVISFDAEGNSEVLYGQQDGLNSPMGANGLAFDGQDNLYVVNDFGPILRFPVDGGPPEPFAGFFNGSLDFAPNGDLFHGALTTGGGAIVHINPEGDWFFFDDPPHSFPSLSFDRNGNLFATSGNSLYSYPDTNPALRRLLATGFLSAGSSGGVPIVVSSDGASVYLAEVPGPLYAVDVRNGSLKQIADVRDLFWWGAVPTGIAAYAPAVAGDGDGDGDVDIADFALFDSCVTGPADGPPTPGCHFADMSNDGDVDRSDFALFQSAFTGPTG